MANIGTLSVSVVANVSKLTKGIMRSRKLIAGFSFAAGLASQGVVSSVVRMGTSFEDFNQQMTRSLAIMGDVSQGLRVNMVEAAREVSSQTQFAARDAAQAYFFLASAGLNAEQSVASLPTVSKFAQAGNFNLALATDLLTDAQSALGLTVNDTAQQIQNMARVGDVLVKANTLANASVQQFSEALTTKAGAGMRLLGMQVEEGVAVLAAFADQGVKGAEAGTALSIVLRDLQTKAIKEADAFRAAGVSVFDATGEFRNMANILRDLEGLLAGLSDQQKKNTLLTLGFSDKSVQFLQTLIGTSEKIREYEKNLRSAGGTMEKVSSQSLTKLQKFAASASASFERLSESVGRFIENVPVLEEFLRLLDKFSRGVEESRKLNAGPGGVTFFESLFLTGEQRAQIQKIQRFAAQPAPTPRGATLFGRFADGVGTGGIGGDGASLISGQLRRASLGLQKFDETLAMVRKKAEQADVFHRRNSAKEAKKATEEMQKRAEQLVNASKTPIQRYVDLIEEVNKLIQAGVLTELKGSAILQAQKKRLALGVSLPQQRGDLRALEFGTAEAFKASRGGKTNKATELAKQQLKVQKDIHKELREQNKLNLPVLGL